MRIAAETASELRQPGALVALMQLALQGPTGPEGMVRCARAALAALEASGPAFAAAWEQAHPEIDMQRHAAFRSLEGCGFWKCCTVEAGGDAAITAKRCSGCKAIRYCCRDCQVGAWPEHKRVCKRLAAQAAADAANGAS